MSSVRVGRLLSLDFLRAFGCLGVVVNHASSLSGLSFLNQIPPFRVELFFVISGVVAYLSLKPTSSLSSFTTKRLVRLLPLYWIATALAVLLFYVKNNSLADTAHIISSLLLIRQPENQLGPILYQTWTLNFEIAFIAVIVASRWMTKKYAFLIAASTILTMSCLRYKIGSYYFDYYLSQRFGMFAVGIALGYLISTRQLLPARLALPACLLMMMVILYNGGEGYGATFVHWGIPVSMLVFSACSAEKQLAALCIKPVTMISKASYSIFLFHPFPIWYFQWNFSEKESIGLFTLAVIASLVIGLTVHKWIEMPLNSVLNRAVKKPDQRTARNQAPIVQVPN